MPPDVSTTVKNIGYMEDFAAGPARYRKGRAKPGGAFLRNMLTSKKRLCNFAI
jgi:hypothetical protein